MHGAIVDIIQCKVACMYTLTFTITQATKGAHESTHAPISLTRAA